MWEYLVTTIPVDGIGQGDHQEALNKLGADRWEVVARERQRSCLTAFTLGYEYVFKRKKRVRR